jgi:hypothetical protein
MPVVAHTNGVVKQLHAVNPHDHFARCTFDVVVHTRALLRTPLPTELLTNLRLDTLQRTRESFLSGFIPDMQAIVIDFSRQSPEIFAQTPELDPRIRTLGFAHNLRVQVGRSGRGRIL